MYNVLVDMVELVNNAKLTWLVVVCTSVEYFYLKMYVLYGNVCKQHCNTCYCMAMCASNTVIHVIV